jgi:YD repeat-containing protein
MKMKFLKASILLSILLFSTRSLLAGTVTYSYDNAGRLITADFGNNRKITYTYDNNGNLLERSISTTIPQYTLTVTKTGTGTVTSNDGGIDCGSDCSESYPDGTVVTLTATPDTGSVFSGWSDDCSACGTDKTCDVTMNTDKACIAQFEMVDIFVDIKANNSDGPVTLNNGDPLSVTIALNCGDYCGDSADWWVVAISPFDRYYYYDFQTDTWAQKCTSCYPLSSYQGPLFNMGPYEVLSTTAEPQMLINNTPDLPVGTYTFYFAVDMDMNGIIDMDQMYYDNVEVNIIQ